MIGHIDPVGNSPDVTRPGGNVTGVNGMVAEPGAKRIGLLHELLPKADRFGVLVNPRVPGSETDIAVAQAAAKALDLSLEVFRATTNREIDAAFARAAGRRQDALAIARSQLITLATHYALPAIFFDRSFVEVGGLMSYGPSLTDQFCQAGIYVGRILRSQATAHPRLYHFLRSRRCSDSVCFVRVFCRKDNVVARRTLDPEQRCVA